MDDDVGTGDELAHPVAIADVAAQLLHGALELGIVERHDVERADLMAVCEQPSRQVQAEEARASRDSPEH